MTTMLKDFGEYIAGAKKDRYFSSVDVNDDNALNLPLSTLWTDKEIAQIDDKTIKAVATVFKNNMPNKPRKRHKIRLWLKLLAEIQDKVNSLFGKDEKEINNFINSIAYQPTRTKIWLLSNIDEKYWKTVLPLFINIIKGQDDKAELMMNNQDYSILHIFKPQSFFDFNNDIRHNAKQIIAEVQNDVELILSFIEKNKKTATKTKKSSEKSFKRSDFAVYRLRSDNTAFICAKKDRLKTRLQSFAKAQDAWDYLAEQNNVDALGKQWLEYKAVHTVNKDEMRNQSNDERTGERIRPLHYNVTPDEFMNTFGIRGGQFGNWVNGDERQEVLNDGFDALMDLAKTLGVHPTAIGLNGRLGIAFGARGHGKASAHYEPNECVINLTKTRGAGSLAHEWWHALDHYLNNGNKLLTENCSFMNSRFVQITPAVDRLISVIKTSDLHQRSLNADSYRNGVYFSTMVEMTARAFEKYVSHKLSKDGIKNDFLVNIREIQNWQKADDAYPYPLDDEIERFSDCFDAIFKQLTDIDGSGFDMLDYGDMQLVHSKTLLFSDLLSTAS